jgi:hypothetical protein
LLRFGEKSHTSGSHEVDGGLGDLFAGDFVEGDFDKFLEVIGADTRDAFGKGGDTGVNLFALLELDLGQIL